ncbi:MAG: bacillithiol biosynthesis BshC, partial [Candidatus Kapaibacterium sp.]
ELSEYVLHVDSQLTRNIQGFEVSIFNLLEQLDKKVHTSAKRNNEETLKKYRAISNSVYPNGILQERAINILQYMTQSEELIDLLLTGNNLSADNHHFIYI